MRVRALSGLFWLLTLAASAPAQSVPATGAASNSQAARVEVWLNVVDKNGQHVTSLRPEDLRVLDGGVPQRIDALAVRGNASRSVVVAIDNSASQERMLPMTGRVAQALIAELVRAGQDRVAVASFSGETILEQDFTHNRALAQGAAGRIGVATPDSRIAGAILSGKDNVTALSTAISDALWLLGDEVFPASPAGSRRVLILLTDGVDTASQTKKREAINRLLAAGVAVYAIGVGDDKMYFGPDKGAIKGLAERTGGRAFFPKTDEQVRAVFAEIEASLRAQYLLGYTPTGASPKETFRKLKIEITNPELRRQGVRVIHPEGYPVARPAAKK